MYNMPTVMLTFLPQNKIAYLQKSAKVQNIFIDADMTTCDS